MWLWEWESRRDNAKRSITDKTKSTTRDSVGPQFHYNVGHHGLTTTSKTCDGHGHVRHKVNAVKNCGYTV